MHRLFVALRPPPPMRAALLDAAGGAPGARWQAADQLHLTLRFIGEVDRHGADDVAAALATVRSAAVPVALAGTGAFDRRGRVHTLFARVHADAGLLRLNTAVERALVQVGIAPEPRAFLPHITLARLAADRATVAPWLTRTAMLAAPAVAIGAMLLFESVLTRERATYHALARYPLIG